MTESRPMGFEGTWELHIKLPASLPRLRTGIHWFIPDAALLEYRISDRSYRIGYSVVAVYVEGRKALHGGKLGKNRHGRYYTHRDGTMHRLPPWLSEEIARYRPPAPRWPPGDDTAREHGDTRSAGALQPPT